MFIVLSASTCFGAYNFCNPAVITPNQLYLASPSHSSAAFANVHNYCISINSLITKGLCLMLMLSTLYTSPSLSHSLSPSLSCCNCYRHFHLLTVDGCMPNDECPGQQHANRNSMPEIDLSTQHAPNSILSILPPVFLFFFLFSFIFFLCFLLLASLAC